jgi:hypothetical protein
MYRKMSLIIISLMILGAQLSAEYVGSSCELVNTKSNELIKTFKEFNKVKCHDICNSVLLEQTNMDINELKCEYTYSYNDNDGKGHDIIRDLTTGGNPSEQGVDPDIAILDNFRSNYYGNNNGGRCEYIAQDGEAITFYGNYYDLAEDNRSIENGNSNAPRHEPFCNVSKTNCSRCCFVYVESKTKETNIEVEIDQREAYRYSSHVHKFLYKTSKSTEKRPKSCLFYENVNTTNTDFYIHDAISTYSYIAEYKTDAAGVEINPDQNTDMDLVVDK